MFIMEEISNEMSTEEFMRELVERLNRKFSFQDMRMEEIESGLSEIESRIDVMSGEINFLKEEAGRLREGHNKISRNILSIID